MAFTDIPVRVDGTDKNIADDINDLMSNTTYNKRVFNIHAQSLLNNYLTIDQYDHVAKPYTITASQEYFIDRWYAISDGGAGTVTVDVSSSAVTTEETGLGTGPGGTKGIVFSCSSGGAGEFGVIQGLDTAVYEHLYGYNVTFSAWVRCSKANTARLRINSNYTSSWHTGSGNWELLTVTESATTIIDADSSLGCVCLFDAPETSDTAEFYGMNLNVGSSRVVPVLRHDEEMLCKWYAMKIHSWTMSGAAYGAGYVQVGFPINMRVEPVNADYLINNYALYYAGTDKTAFVSSVTLAAGVTDKTFAGLLITLTGVHGIPTSGVCRLVNTSTTTSYIFIQAEV